MKNKGFTLIELLGVIIILALITLLVFPSIINSVRNASNKTDDLTLELIYNASNLYISNHKDNFIQKEGKKNIINLSDLVEEDLLVSPIKLSNNEDITNEKCVQVTYKDGFNFELRDIGTCEEIYLDGQEVYFDVSKGESCTNYTKSQSNTGVKSGCMKFYAFNDKGEENLNLLLDHNTTALIPWNSKTDVSSGPYDLLVQLYNDTKNWKGTEILNDYTLDQRGQTSNFYYTIEYSKVPSITGATEPYKARIISLKEILEITGADKELNYSETLPNGSLYLDTYKWLYSNLDDNCGNVCYEPLTAGYWTSTTNAGLTRHSWIVYFEGRIGTGEINLTGSYGVRPVITVLKSKL